MHYVTSIDIDIDCASSKLNQAANHGSKKRWERRENDLTHLKVRFEYFHLLPPLRPYGFILIPHISKLPNDASMITGRSYVETYHMQSKKHQKNYNYTRLPFSMFNLLFHASIKGND